VVREIEYDPNRTANIALVEYQDGERRYILHPVGLKVGDTVQSGSGGHPHSATRSRSAEIPLGTTVHNIELRPGKGGQMARSAGAGVQIVAKEGEFVTLRMPSTEMRMVRRECMATIGQVGNVDHRQAVDRQGRREPLARQAAQGPRRRDEPGRSPARRRRGQDVGRSPAGQRPGARRRASRHAPARRPRTSSSSAAASAARRRSRPARGGAPVGESLSVHPAPLRRGGRIADSTIPLWAMPAMTAVGFASTTGHMWTSPRRSGGD
jgi:large subunit ribosomal protein L2